MLHVDREKALMRINMVAVPVADGDERLIGAVPPEALFKFFEPNI
jgi:hypothetical protein